MRSDHDFASLLDALSGDPIDEPKSARAAFSFDHLAVAESLRSSTPPASGSFLAAGYADALEPFEPPETQPALMPIPEPPSIDPAAVAAELDLAHLDAAGLALIRKDFARRNHPDRVPAAIQAAALHRMQIANAMIDEAEKRLVRPAA